MGGGQGSGGCGPGGLAGGDGPGGLEDGDGVAGAEAGSPDDEREAAGGKPEPAPFPEAVDALVIGGGPAGLRAAEALAAAGRRVVVAERMPTLARKLLMAGRSGLNLTRQEEAAAMAPAFGAGWARLRPMIAETGPEAVQAWARGLGQPLYTGSTGRVFPQAMKASPLLRAWRARLDGGGVEVRARWRWTGLAGAGPAGDGARRRAPPGASDGIRAAGAQVAAAPGDGAMAAPKGGGPVGGDPPPGGPPRGARPAAALSDAPDLSGPAETAWAAPAFLFDTPEGPRAIRPAVAVLALGGASWRRLGSDGAWAAALASRGVPLAPFAAANAGLAVRWSKPMARHFGAALKSVALRAGGAAPGAGARTRAPLVSRGEVVVSARGLEGGGLYPLTPALRAGAPLTLDLAPDRDEGAVERALARVPSRVSLANRLRRALRLSPVKVALLREWGDPSAPLAVRIKALTARHEGLRPMDEAISTAGGVAWEGLDEGLMLRAVPGVFACGEMLDWEAPTGGYLLTACLATGAWAGRHAALWRDGCGLVEPP